MSCKSLNHIGCNSLRRLSLNWDHLLAIISHRWSFCFIFFWKCICIHKATLLGFEIFVIFLWCWWCCWFGIWSWVWLISIMIPCRHERRIKWVIGNHRNSWIDFELVRKVYIKMNWTSRDDERWFYQFFCLWVMEVLLITVAGVSICQVHAPMVIKAKNLGGHIKSTIALHHGLLPCKKSFQVKKLCI